MSTSTTEENNIEALTSLRSAIVFRNKGNYEKAKVLLDHALALAPTHPDILTEYGIFMENVQNNLLDAHTMYTKALTVNSNHIEASRHIQRTLPLVETIDNRMLHEIDEKRKQFLSIPRCNNSLRRAIRESYFQHIYHTVALEGNTMSLAQTRSILETNICIGGKSLTEHNEILGMDSAFRYLNRNMVNRVGEISMEDLLQLHRRVLGFVDPDAAGVLRETQVYVGTFTPVPPETVHDEMCDLIHWLNTESRRMHPVELAALAHYKFAYIHPFADGNGRTARLLMNLILMQAGFPPVIIPVEHRAQYTTTLRTANDGDLRPFIRFIASHTNHTLQDYIDLIDNDDVQEVNDVTECAEPMFALSRIAAT